MVKPTGKSGSKNGVTMWQMIRDVCVTAINKGQFPAVGLVMLIAVVILKMPGPDVSELAAKVYGDLITLRLVGWGLSVALMAGWAIHGRRQRGAFYSEIERIGREKSYWQQRALGDIVRSSEAQRKALK